MYVRTLQLLPTLGGGLSDPDYLWEGGRAYVFALNPASKYFRAQACHKPKVIWDEILNTKDGCEVTMIRLL